MTLTEYLDKLRTVADGALNRIDERRTTEVEKPLYTDLERQRNWWDGQRQAIDVIAEFVARNPS